MTIQSISTRHPYLILVTQDAEVQSILEHLGKPLDKYDGLLVELRNAEYTRAYGFYGSVPYNDKPVYSIRSKVLGRPLCH